MSWSNSTVAAKRDPEAAVLVACWRQTGVGTIVEEGKQKVQLGGKTFLLETALRADFALIHASPGSHHSRATYPLSLNQRMTHECARQSHVSALARDDHPVFVRPVSRPSRPVPCRDL